MDRKEQLLQRLRTSINNTPNSTRAAINYHCCECIFDTAEKGTWRYQTEHCPVTHCGLHHLRPKQKK